MPGHDWQIHRFLDRDTAPDQELLIFSRLEDKDMVSFSSSIYSVARRTGVSFSESRHFQVVNCVSDELSLLDFRILPLYI
jgi:hypothetical protein